MHCSYRPIARILVFCVMALPILLPEVSPKTTTVKAVKKLSYKNDIVPIMKIYCLPCHTEDAMNPSNLYLDAYRTMMAGGKHGPAVVPGKPDSSLLVLKISFTPPFGDPMPMKRKVAFPSDTLGILRNWILQGAKNN
jgi:hypothetical protein